MASDKYATIAVTKDARAHLNSVTARVIGLTGRRLSNSEVLDALLDVAERHPDEIRERLGRSIEPAK